MIMLKDQSSLVIRPQFARRDGMAEGLDLVRSRRCPAVAPLAPFAELLVFFAHFNRTAAAERAPNGRPGTHPHSTRRTESGVRSLSALSKAMGNRAGLCMAPWESQQKANKPQASSSHPPLQPALPVMLRTPLDGRARKNPDGELPRVQPVKKAYPANLKEAAPPKTNPWRCVKVPSSQSEDLPKPSDQAAAAAAVTQNHSAAKSQVLKKDAPLLSSRKCHQRSVSHESPASVRDKSQTTASCAGESLWNLPFGADISLYAEDKVLHLHRSVVAPKSGWLRDKLLPPHSNGAPVGVFFPGPAKIIGHSLKFMYTDRLEPCEPKPDSPHDISYVVCCSLFYLAAADLQAPCIASHILAILLRASDDWQGRLEEGICGLVMSRQDGMAFTIHLQDALEAAYAYPQPEIVKPLRLALVGFLDVVLPFIFKNPNVVTLLSTPVWCDHSSAMAVDLVEHRRRRKTMGAMATSQELEALFETLSKGGYSSATWSSRRKAQGPLSPSAHHQSSWHPIASHRVVAVCATTVRFGLTARPQCSSPGDYTFRRRRSGFDAEPRRRRSGFTEESRRRRPVAVLWSQTGKRIALYEDHGRLRVRAERRGTIDRRSEDTRGDETSPTRHQPSWSPRRRIRTRAGLFVGDGEAPAEDDAAESESEADDEESLRDVEPVGSRSSYSLLDDGIQRESRSPIGDEVDVLASFEFVSPGAKASCHLSELLDKAGQESDGIPTDDDGSLRPADATSVFSSAYTGEAELGGSHGAALTVLQHGPARTHTQHVMSFDDFWAEISHRVRFSEDEKRATAKLRADVKRHAIKSRQNERGKTVGLMEPLYRQVPLGGAKEEKKAARWICLPYFSLQPFSGLLAASSPVSFPPQTLLQSQYSRTPRQRDMRQAVCQLGMAPKGDCFHIAQVWCLVLDNSLLVTCSSMSQLDLCGRSLKLVSQPPPREPGSNGCGRILVSYGSAVQWVFRVRDCPTWFSFVSRFSAFWPESVEFRWRDRVVEPGSWPKMLKLASLPRASVLLRLKVITPKADVHKTVPASQPAEATAEEAGEPRLKDLHVLTLRPRDSMTASVSHSEAEELRAQLAAAEEFLLSNTSFSQQRAYKSCISASRQDVLASLASQTFEAEADDAMRASHEERVELYGLSEMIFNLFLPPDFDGPTADKFWGSVSSFVVVSVEFPPFPRSPKHPNRGVVDVKSDSPQGDDGHARALRDSLRPACKNIQAFQRIMAHADDQTRAKMALPRQFVTAWLHVVAGVVSASGAQAGWRAQLDKAKALVEQGMRAIVQADTSRSLVDDSAVLPMEVVSLIAAELLQDRVGREDDVIDTYSQFLGSLNTDITTKPSDRSYQHRIELVRQEMAVVERTLSSQRQVIEDIRNGLPYQSSGDDDDVLWRRRDVVVTGTVTRRREAMTAPWPMVSGRTRMATERMGLVQLRPEELAAASKLSSTDELGFRDLLLAECGRVIEARELELQRLGEYAEELEQDVIFKMGSTKDRQENAIYAFTLVTIIFLPLSAISSIFGMNTNDIRNMAFDQWLYWAIALPVTVAVILAGLWWMGEFGGATTTSEERRRAGSRERVVRSRTERRARRTRTF
ncbi:hypothetical protein L249_3396 [Ophiocordyceps polyrhachis-furcata BCC 54312]|uniref:BTB domain-containing protein n=1 Tax=Ophiocordyceps polyrhachis-furcata BCC 54312 TaxID=1330021 RepID=A0A367LM81_9HYPO|nr:hypothetical protein L249_3396 [Ophiocordyceps polyrhachis-furcata BCC 54312]